MMVLSSLQSRLRVLRKQTQGWNGGSPGGRGHPKSIIKVPPHACEGREDASGPRGQASVTTLST